METSPLCVVVLLWSSACCDTCMLITERDRSLFLYSQTSGMTSTDAYKQTIWIEASVFISGSARIMPFYGCAKTGTVVWITNVPQVNQCIIWAGMVWNDSAAEVHGAKLRNKRCNQLLEFDWHSICVRASTKATVSLWMFSSLAFFLILWNSEVSSRL